MKKLLSVMLRIGFFGFGGGTALIPVIEEAVVEEEKLIDEDAFNKDVIVANITPGALPVEIAACIGKQVRGIPGMILAAVMMALPGSLLTAVLVSLIHGSGAGVLRQITFASAGVTCYIIYMLLEYTKGTVRECRKNHTTKRGVAVLVAVFLLTSGKELFQVFGIDAVPFFDISTVNILAIAFFVIFFTRGKFKKSNVIISICIVGLYLLCVGKSQIIPYTEVKLVLRLIMLALGLYGLYKSMEGRMCFEVRSLKGVLTQVLAWGIFLFLLSLPALFLVEGTLQFIGNGVLSTFLSFGGGDAYLALANGFFVNTDMISYQDFYQNIVVVANALPGSILCKVLTGVGFVMGNQAGGVGVGYLMALVGFAAGVAASGGTAAAVTYIYERFETLVVFRLIKLSIRPIVSGLLLSVCLSMLYQNMIISLTAGNSVPILLMLTLGIVLFNIWMKRKSRIRPIFMVIFSAGLSLILCNVIHFCL